MRQGLVISILLTGICLFTASAFAYDWSSNPGNGSAGNPYQISTPEQLVSVGLNNNSQLNISLLGASYILINDIDMDPLITGFPPFTTAVIAPVLNNPNSFPTTFSMPFTGTFDGKGYKVKNLKIDSSSELNNNLGLFGNIANGTVKNLGVVNISIIGDEGSQSCGGLSGYASGATISQCYTTGQIEAASYIGGLIGRVEYGITISECYSQCSVAGEGYTQQFPFPMYVEPVVGGLVGYCYGEIESCYSTGSVTGDGERVGGLVGINKGAIDRCYAAGSVAGSGSDIGGFIGNNSGDVTASFYDLDISGRSDSSGAKGLETFQMKSLLFFQAAGWDNSSWVMAEGVDYPRLYWEGTGYPPISSDIAIPLTGSGTESDPYQIWTVEEFKLLSWIPDLWDKHLVLMSDLDFSNVSFNRIAETGSFSGIFEGNNHILSNITKVSGEPTGVFSTIAQGGQVNNLHLKNIAISGNCGLAVRNQGLINGCSVTGTLSGANSTSALAAYNEGLVANSHVTATISGNNYVGGLVARNQGQIVNCHVTGEVSGKQSVGGLAGFNNRGDISDCTVSTTIISTGDYAGGFVGLNEWGAISGCNSAGSITGKNYAGGFVGTNTGQINACYSTGNVTAVQRIGGFVGNNYNDGIIEACFSTGHTQGTRQAGGFAGTNSGQINVCYSTGNVTAVEDMVGGLVGQLDGLVRKCYAVGNVSGSGDEVGGLIGDYFDGEIIASFWDIETTGQAGSGGGKGLTSVQMKSVEIFQDAGWNGTQWVMNDSIGTPRLAWEATGYPEIPSLGPVPLNGSGTASDPYQIWTAQEFALLSWYTSVLDKQIELKADIELTNMPIFPIGDLGKFTGHFNGGGHIISNILLNVPKNDFTALFSVVGSEGAIEHLTLSNINITGGDYVGALAGKSYGQIGNCHITGSVVGLDYVGGVVGRDYEGEIRTCSFSGSVSGSVNVGGVLGWKHVGIISHCNSTGQVRAVQYAGGLVGAYNGTIFVNGFANIGNGTIEDCYSTALIDATDNNVGGLIGSNGGAISNCYAEGSVSGDDYVGGLVGSNSGEISNCIASGAVVGSGWVGGLTGSHANLSITDCSATGDVTGHAGVGGLVGYNDSILIHCNTTGDVNGNNRLGGLVGYVQLGHAINCSAAGSVTGTGDDIGGLIGYLWSGSLTKSYSEGSVKGRSRVGGLAGRNESQILDCYTTGSITGVSNVGGLVGKNYNGDVNRCYAVGFIEASGSNVGGLVGHNDSYSQSTSYNFWNLETTGITDPAQGVGNMSPPTSAGPGRPTADMKIQSTFTDYGWDFVEETANGTEDIWLIDEGNDYPRLWWEFSNTPPIADSGEDQMAYAGINGYALIQLDATDSNDVDGDVLEYYWFNDANELIATGAEPNVLFGVGEYEVTLIVNDGIEDSEPNTFTVAVLPAIERDGKITPQSLNRKSHRPHVIGRLDLSGSTTSDLDTNFPMILMPGSIVADEVDILGSKKNGNSLSLKGHFDNDLLMDAIEQDGDVEVTIAVQLLTGQWVYGTDIVKVK